ncbi:hypothetical protein AeNC1_018735, partial [Aphanomyces euteiches]
QDSNVSRQEVAQELRCHIDPAVSDLGRDIAARFLDTSVCRHRPCSRGFGSRHDKMVSRLEAVSDDACQDICGVQSINAWYVDIHRHLLQDGVHTDQ